MDVLARRRLWDAGLDYGHGTGHGVGHFLNVHEGPQGVSRGRTEPLLPGMNVTDEPGYYEEGEFGIRIENVLFVRESTSVPDYWEFENVTMVPYCRSMIDMAIMEERDVAYVNAYH